MLQTGESGNGCDLALTLCRYDLFVLSWTRERRVREYLFRAHNVRWRCAQHFVIASCGMMPRLNRCMYMTHVCFSICYSDCVEFCGNVLV